jgi:hypothetical protein
MKLFTLEQQQLCKRHWAEIYTSSGRSLLPWENCEDPRVGLRHGAHGRSDLPTWGRQIAPVQAQCRPIASPTSPSESSEGASRVPYRITAERDNETMRSSRSSVWVAVAKGRVWASEGWRVVITDDSGRDFVSDRFDELLPFQRKR